MNFLRAALPVIFALIAVSAHSGKRTVVTLQVEPESNVADIFRTPVRGSSQSEGGAHKGLTGFHFPTAPEFTKRRFYQSVPSNMKSYPAFYKTPYGKLTTASMIRFIKQSPSMFDNKLLRSGYEKALAECIQAHKTWFASKTDENHTKLRECEERILKLLEKLPLENPITRHQLQRMLSTPKRGRITRAWDWLILNKRSAIQTVPGKTAGKPKTIVVPNQSWKLTSLSVQVLKCLPIAWLAGEVSEYFGQASIILMAASSILRFKKDHRLTVEPSDGIKVKIEFDEGESCDASGDGGFSQGATQR